MAERKAVSMVVSSVDETAEWLAAKTAVLKAASSVDWLAMSRAVSTVDWLECQAVD
jgi:hypothetical protein